MGVWLVTLNWPLEQQGSTGENVRSVQYLLNDHGSAVAVDGDFGLQTSAAVRAFQASHGLGADGIVGNQTWPVLIVQVSAGSSGGAVRAVQSQIHSRSGWLTIDGILGPETESAIRFFQEDIGLSVDGIVGARTWNALVSGYLRAQGGQACSQHVFQAWTHDDRVSAGQEATPQAVDALFARTWHAADGWSFDQCDVAAGSFFCTWRRSGEQLILGGNDNTGAPFYVVNNVTFQP
jgi:peptidoglycan hydrolase-like protein with peptidoglycan-binding domain